MSRLYFISDFLNGNQQAKLILSDLLEEEGQAELAIRVRKFQPNNNVRKTLIFGINLLPFELCIELSANYFQRAISPGLRYDPVERLLSQIAEWGRSLFENSPDAEELSDMMPQVIKGLQQLPPKEVSAIAGGPVKSRGYFSSREDFEKHFNRAIEAMVVLVRYALDLQEFKRTEYIKKVSSRNNAVHTQVNFLAAACKVIPNDLKRRLERRSLDFVHAQQVEMKWQLQHLKTLLRERAS